jgi:hypothetical protein
MNVKKFRHEHPRNEGYINKDAVLIGIKKANREFFELGIKMNRLKQVTKQSTESL